MTFEAVTEPQRGAGTSTDQSHDTAVPGLAGKRVMPEHLDKLAPSSSAELVNSDADSHKGCMLDVRVREVIAPCLDSSRALSSAPDCAQGSSAWKPLDLVVAQGTVRRLRIRAQRQLFHTVTAGSSPEMGPITSDADSVNVLGWTEL